MLSAFPYRLPKKTTAIQISVIQRIDLDADFFGGGGASIGCNASQTSLVRKIDSTFLEAL
jgi:hypothetical protein